MSVLMGCYERGKLSASFRQNWVDFAVKVAEVQLLLPTKKGGFLAIAVKKILFF